MENKLTNKEILDTISNEWTKHNSIVFNSDDGLYAVKVENIIEAPYQEILVGLGRDFTEIYNLAAQADNGLNGIYEGVNKHRFINDLATSYIIKVLKEKLDNYDKDDEIEKRNNKIQELENIIKKLNMEIAYYKYN